MRGEVRRVACELSYDCMLEDGYDAAMDESIPEDVVVNKMMCERVKDVTADLEGEEKDIADYIKEGKSLRKFAEEKGMSLGTAHNHTQKLMIKFSIRIDKK